MPSATIPYGNFAGRREDSARFVIPGKSSEEASMKKSPQGSAMSANRAGSDSMILLVPFSPGTINPSRSGYCVLYFMGLNISNEQIAQELDISRSDVQEMTTQLREGVVKKNRK